MTDSNILTKYLDDIGTFTPSYDEIHSQDLGVPEDKELYKLTDIESLNDKRSKYSVREKLQTVTMWAVLGNIAEVSRRTGVAKDTIKYWKNETEWWGEAIERIKLQRNEKLDADITRAIDMSMGELADRIKKGDEVILKDGSTARKKMSGRDLALISSMLYDKRSLMRGDIASTRATNSTQAEVLQQLKSSFEKLSTSINKRLEEKVVSNQ